MEVDDASGVVAYVEHHRTLGDWVRLLAARDFRLVDLVEPEWPEQNDRVWGGWSRARGLLTTGSSDFHGPEHPHFSRFRAHELHGRQPELGPIAS